MSTLYVDTFSSAAAATDSLWGGALAATPLAQPAGADDAALRQLKPTTAEEAAIAAFTPGYKAGGGVELLPGLSPDNKHVGRFDTASGRAMVWQGSAAQQADKLGVDREKFTRAVAIQELSHQNTYTNFPKADPRALEVMGDAVTIRADREIGALNSLSNGLSIHQASLPGNHPAGNSYAYIYQSAEKGLKGALNDVGYGAPPNGETAMQFVGQRLFQYVSAGQSYAQALKSVGADLAAESGGKFDADKFYSAVITNVSREVEARARIEMKNLN